MNIVKRELRSNLKSMIIWSVSIGVLVTLWMVEFESFANNPYLGGLLNSMPQGILAAMGLIDLNLTSLGGFISGIGIYIYLLLGIHGGLLGSSIISKEERDRTGEYLFTLPISRERVIVGKICSAVINLLILNIITIGSIILTSINYDKSDGFYKFIGLFAIAIFLIQMIFLSIGMLVASVIRRYKKSGNISVTILMITFFMSSLINIVESLDFLKYILPFKYFELSKILSSGQLDPVFIFISIAIVVCGIGGTMIFYPRRDLYI